MNIAETRRGGNLIVAPIGRMDSSAAPLFDRQISAIIERGDTNIILDLAGTEYIGSTGLSVILSAAKKIKQAGGRMALSCMNQRIRLVFEMSGFLRLLPVFPTVDAAIAG